MHWYHRHCIVNHINQGKLISINYLQNCFLYKSKYHKDKIVFYYNVKFYNNTLVVLTKNMHVFWCKVTTLEISVISTSWSTLITEFRLYWVYYMYMCTCFNDLPKCIKHQEDFKDLNRNINKLQRTSLVF